MVKIALPCASMRLAWPDVVEQVAAFLSVLFYVFCKLIDIVNVSRRDCFPQMVRWFPLSAVEALGQLNRAFQFAGIRGAFGAASFRRSILASVVGAGAGEGEMAEDGLSGVLLLIP